MPTMKINGQEVTVDKGTTVLQAAEKIGIEIPTFCYHPGLSIAANCRMCLVDTNKSPKPLPACHAQAMDDMEVFTESEGIKKTRKSVLEFILLNHPVDCPICDQAGECVLQDHYFRYSSQPSRLTHRKQHKAKAKVLGPDVILDAERCILCTRCIRFCDEIAGQSQLEIVNRGEKSEITTFPGEELDNPYAVNTVDICPVGALTQRSFRFRTRVWMLSSERSVCPECARGCTIRVDTYENVPRRYKPAHNPKVNDYWMCDEGRNSFARYVDDRMEGPTVISDDGRRMATGTAQALEHAARAIADAGGPTRAAVVATPWMTNEDAYLLGRLLTGPMAGAHLFMGGRQGGEGDDVLIRPDKNPNTRGVGAIFAALGLASSPLAELPATGLETIVVFGDNHAASEATMEAIRAVPRRVVVGQFMSDWWKLATTFLPGRVHWEKDGSFTNFDGVVQRIRSATRAASTCKSDGFYAMKLAAHFGADWGFTRPREVFEAMAAVVPEFAGMTLDGLGEHGIAFGEVAAPPPEAPSQTEGHGAAGGAA